MRITLGALLLLLITGCQTRPAPTLVTQCTDPRPQVCTMEYAPVCAALVAGGSKQYSSACNACADDAVSGYLSGECPE
ncbi:hypothetical protein DWB85_08675 [Seongchinamella sediminis]|uniref:Kazal-like domain-containing protein n=1 Tax=Seongchinamella sediminis TaxID=2283635 RepID=A0A3L7E248_9GAMM|nr:hypothetical protein [Seongchinamella sediminis]RLQ22341.1 hypothetical protein DWB85_08675 [Seongchinamella sediminis]